MYGQTELLANFGGLLGFFLGISLLSFVEIIYFFTLRTFLLVKRKILPKDSAETTNERKSNVKINIIQPSPLNAIDRRQTTLPKKEGLSLRRNDSISQGLY